MSTINTIDDLKFALMQLQHIDPRFTAVVEAVGIPPLRRVEDGFESLVDIIASQQVSRASADAIIARMRENLKPYTWQGFQQFSDQTYVAQGLSRPKIKTLRALSEALGNRELVLEGLREMSDDDVATALMRIKGIGPWTAEIYLLTCLGRADIWPAGDIALQVGVEMICQLQKRPSADETRKIAEAWQPWRSVAARLVWSFYAYQKELKSKNQGTFG
jgi:DNA-3-methyladenine glycosylase II